MLDFEIRFYSSNNFKRRLFKNIFRGGNKLILSICTFFWICCLQSFLTSVLKLFLSVISTTSSSFPKLRLLITLHGDKGSVLSMPKHWKCSKFFLLGLKLISVCSTFSVSLRKISKGRILRTAFKN